MEARMSARTTLRFLLLVVLAWSLSGCPSSARLGSAYKDGFGLDTVEVGIQTKDGEDGQDLPQPDVPDGWDVSPDGLDVPDTEDIPDAPDIPDVPPDWPDASDIPDVPPDWPDTPDAPDIPVHKPFGAPCFDHYECASGLCLNTALGQFCSEWCQGDCPPGYVCRVDLSMGEPVSVCMPDVDRSCQVCDSHWECVGGVCPSDGALAGACLTDCTWAPCPFGTRCDPVQIPGQPQWMDACVPESGSCDCTAATAGQVRPCVVENEFGACAGFELCLPGMGWTDCSADTPAPEQCNGLDDDCDGQIDQALAATPCSNTTPGVDGACPGWQACLGAQGWVCDAPYPAPESCNGLDDDCDGQVDDPWRVNGAYVHEEACGSCLTSCVDPLPPNAASAACDATMGSPACVVTSCVPPTVPLDAFTCGVPADTSCLPCDEPSICGPGGDCVVSVTGDAVCAMRCDEGGDCLDGYGCVDIPGADGHCLPDSGTCDCTPETDGQTRACQRVSPWGTCTGVSACDAAIGWS
jgi:hypothetical protein